MSDTHSQVEAGAGTTLNRGADVAFVRTTMVPVEPAPDGTTGAIGWLRQNLFSSPVNILQTALAVLFVVLVAPGLFEFAVLNAVWTGENRAVCATEVQGGVRENGWVGACWAYVGTYLQQFIYGVYPFSERWRVNVTFVLLILALLPLLVPTFPYKRAGFAYSAVVFPVAAFVLLTGGELHYNGFLLPTFWYEHFPAFLADALLTLGQLDRLTGEQPLVGTPVLFWVEYMLFSLAVVAVAAFVSSMTSGNSRGAAKTAAVTLASIGAILLVCSIDFGLPHVRTELWGGMLVTLVIAITGIAVSLPLGILLALARRSDMVLVRLLAVMFIEFWRGVPLVTVLFMSSVMLPLIASEGVSVDKLLRALIGVALFASAYMAEVIRGGLQAIPKGQYEGAQAVGLTYWQSMRLIILPQALTLVIPGIVNTFIGLFKDTTLVLIIGLFDFLGQIQASFSDPNWGTPVQSSTAYLFAATVYFVFCFGMSRYSIYMENRLDTGHKS